MQGKDITGSKLDQQKKKKEDANMRDMLWKDFAY